MGETLSAAVAGLPGFADAGIHDDYRLLDPPEHPRLSAYRLRQGRYRPIAEPGEPVTITLAGTRVRVDPTSLGRSDTDG